MYAPLSFSPNLCSILRHYNYIFISFILHFPTRFCLSHIMAVRQASQTMSYYLLCPFNENNLPSIYNPLKVFQSKREEKTVGSSTVRDCHVIR